MRLEPPVPAEALAAIRAPFAAAGAASVEVAVLQPLALLLDLSGEAMRPRLFVVQAEGGEELALRPDFTIPVARAHLDSGADAGRYAYEGKAFRAAPQGSVRAEEFLQIGVEVFGGGDVAQSDAEVVGLAWRSALAGGRSDLSLIVGDIALFAAFVDSLALAPALAARLKRLFTRPRLLQAELDRAGAAPDADDARLVNPLEGVPEGQGETALRRLWAIAGIEPVGARPVGEIVQRLAERTEAARTPPLSPAEADAVRRFLAVSDAPAAALETIRALAGPAPRALDAAIARWTHRLTALAGQGVAVDRITLTAAFGRAFGYYDGLVFEVRSAALGEERPVAAGGRYDGLPARLGAPSAQGAVGCMVRPARAFAGGVE
ncbi:MAG: ATP phosphoribosyltransferase regulatory subunit [Caulobacter sp.]|nr:ATP phosphoribosyltransferase regulatory subunit [Caulobacter sp.]